MEKSYIVKDVFKNENLMKRNIIIKENIARIIRNEQKKEVQGLYNHLKK